MGEGTSTRSVRLDKGDIPQCSNVQRLLAFAEQHAVGRPPTAESMGVDKRQIDYYNEGLRILGLLSSSGAGTPALRAIHALGHNDRLARLAIAFDRSRLGQAWCEWSGVRCITRVEADSAHRFLTECSPLGAGTAEHRTTTLMSWWRALAPRHPSAAQSTLGGARRPAPETVEPTPILDRHEHARVIERLSLGSALVRAATAYFTVFGYEILAKRLIEAEMRLLVGSPEARSTVEEIVSEYRRSIEQGEPSPAKRAALLRLHRELVVGTARVRHLEPRYRAELHAKVYVFDERAALVGSANLTYGGLRANFEGGQVVTDDRSVLHFARRFDELFAEAVDLLPEVLDPIERSWAMEPLASPWLIYLRVLLELYGELPEVQASSFRLADYQKMIVGSVLAVLREHRAAMLIAPTGTGKTVVGAYIAAALFPGDVQRVIVVPPNESIGKEWERVLWSFGVSPTILRHGFFQGKGRDTEARAARLEQVVGGVRSTDLFIIDESHTFRNDDTKGFETLERVLRRVQPSPYRLLLTATPMSTGLGDLNTQLHLVSPNAHLQRVQDVEHCPYLVNVTLPFILQRFGRQTAGSRSRPLVFDTKERHFPHTTVRTLRYEPTMGAVFAAIQSLDFRVVRSSSGGSQMSLPGLEGAVEAHTVQGFLRVLLLRLAESSPAALTSCLRRLPERMEKWVYRPADPRGFRQSLVAIELMLGSSETDSKLEAFLGRLAQFDVEQKVLVFTSFTETVGYLVDTIRRRLPDRRVAGLTGAMGAQRKELLSRFAPVAHHRAERRRKDDLDILVCTDAISEGENLQDAAVVINYDLHWTPLRLIQRVGRVDRPAKAERTIQVWNTYPGHELFENLVGLWTRLENRADFYRDVANTVVLGEHDRDLGDIDASSVGSVRAIYNEAEYASILSTYLPTTRHIVELSSATPSELNAARALPLGSRGARAGNHEGLFLLVRRRGGRALTFRSGSALRVAPLEVAPEALLPHVASTREEATTDEPADMDDRVSTGLQELAARLGEPVEDLAVVCAEWVSKH